MDENQIEIVEALRIVGAGVVVLSALGDGVPDLLVAFRRKLYLIDVKAEGATFTPAQKQFNQDFPAPIYIVRSAADALRLLGVELIVAGVDG